MNEAEKVIPPEGLEAGIYFGLSDEDYHADPALGSSNLKRLKESPADMHWSWSGNPNRQFDKETEALVFGRAVHKLVLEGREAFDSLYVQRPDGPDVLITLDDMKAWLGARMLSMQGNKAQLAERIIAFDKRVIVQEQWVAKAKAEGKTLISAENFFRIMVASAYITRNPNLAGSFTDGYPEVSIFWLHRRKSGALIRMKCRIDYLRLAQGGLGLVDLKSFRNSRGLPIEEAFDHAAARYTVQGAHYMDGVRQVRRLLQEGRVFGDHDPEWLERASKQKELSFALILYKADGAPFANGRFLSPKNELILTAERDIETALDSFEKYYRTFGNEGPWVSLDQPRELFHEDLPRYLTGR